MTIFGSGKNELPLNFSRRSSSISSFTFSGRFLKRTVGDPNGLDIWKVTCFFVSAKSASYGRRETMRMHSLEFRLYQDLPRLEWNVTRAILRSSNSSMFWMGLSTDQSLSVKRMLMKFFVHSALETWTNTCLSISSSPTGYLAEYTRSSSGIPMKDSLSTSLPISLELIGNDVDAEEGNGNSDATTRVVCKLWPFNLCCLLSAFSASKKKYFSWDL